MTNQFDAIWGRLSERLGEEAKIFAAARREAPAQAAELLALPPQLRARRVQAEPRFHSRALVMELIDRARGELDKWGRPERALPSLKVALEVLRRLEGCSRGRAGLRELRVEALCELGEAWRRLWSLSWAESCLRQAARALLDSPDATARALFCGRLARLRVDQRRGDEAVALFARAAVLWAEVGDRERSAAARGELGLARLRLGETGMSPRIRRDLGPIPRELAG